MHTPETFIIAGLRFDNAGGIWGDFQRSEAETRLFQIGSRVRLETGGFDGQDILASAALPSDNQQTAVTDLAYSIWDAVDAGGMPTLRVVEARAIEVNRQQIGGLALSDLWPFMQDHIPYIEDVVEMRGVLLGEKVFVDDFMQ